MKKLTIFLLTTLFLSCSNSSQQDTYSLVQAEKSLSFPLDINTRNFIIALFPFTDKDGKEYLTFQNFGQNEILFYDMNSQKLDFKLRPTIDGANGVGTFIGYYIYNMDSIFLTTNRKVITIINKEAQIIDKIAYRETIDGIPLRSFHFTSAYYNPPVFIGDEMYIRPGCNRWIEKNIATATINLKTKAICALPFFYSSYPGADNKTKVASMEDENSSCFNGKDFVYSFFFEENIKITSPEHKEIKEIPVKSKYIDKIKFLDDYGNLTHNDICENPNYGNLLYDQYRDIYYRIAYPATEIDKNIKGIELKQYGRKNFSIIILDKDFNIIGETLFPDYTYNSTLMFIHEDGLYISDSHYLNPTFSDDILSFKLFTLEKDK